MPESKKKKTGGFRESLLNAGKAFVTYRLPGLREQVMMTGTVKTPEMQSLESRITGSFGFLMTGFSPQTPTLWLEADYFSRYPANEILPDFSIPEKEIPLPDNPFFEITEEKYRQQVEKITGMLKDGVASKVVLSRMLSTPFTNPLAVPFMFDWLCKTHPDAFIYLAFLPPYGLWIGATPERLVGYKNQQVATMALAGTRRAGKAGDWSLKDTGEHTWVADFIQEKLEQSECKFINRSGPYTSNAGQAEHMRTDFSAACPSSNIARLISELHPTPAVCGWPRSIALEIIEQTEKHQRSYYTGYLGPAGNDTADLFVNLRCMQIVPGKALIYAGGGLTADSIPQAEWDETVLKSGTMMAAIEKFRNLALF